MSLEKNKAIIRRWIEALNKRDLASVNDLIAPDYVEPTFQLKGFEGAKQLMAMSYKGFPDYQETIEDIIAEGDKVWSRITFTGTHTGEFLGLAPTGKKVTFTGVAVWHIVDGKIVDIWEVYDLLDFYKQLGLIEYTGKGKKFFDTSRLVH